LKQQGNRRYGNVFPGKKRQDTGNKLLIAVDISGSIELPKFKQFTAHINKFTRFASFDIVFFNDYLVDENGQILFSGYEAGTDTRKAIRHFRLNQKQRMGGGTNFEPIMQLWNKVCNQYDGLFIFTDGDASYSTKPKHPREVNWIAYPNYDGRLTQLKDGNVFNMNNEKYNREMPKVR
jgi:predicted metal-dependent peptidase